MPDRRAFITGASSGLGRALARELLDHGWSVAGAARRRDALEEALRSPGGKRGLALPLDVTDEGALRAALARAAGAFGGLDVVVANAGIGVPGPLAEQEPGAIERVFSVNVVAATTTLTAALPWIEGSERPLLVGVSSLAGFRGGPHAGPYNASKAAFSRMLESLRAELADRGVRVLEVAPGFVRTAMTDRNPFPMPFLVEVEDAARRIRRAIERRRGHLAFPWQLAWPLGLLRRLPDGAFDRLARSLTRRLRRAGRLGGTPPVGEAPTRAGP